MSEEIRLDGRVAIVTGAGGGLGRAHALALAARGAAVVVNDLGAARDGAGSSDSPARLVVAEIESAGGRAVADASDIATPEGAQALAGAALSAFGRIDALVNNAGFLRDKSLAKMEPLDFEAVLRVHLTGSALMSRAVWPAMQEQGDGRIVMTTSAAGLYGNFGQSNYGAAKLGVIGLMNTLKLEGARHGIRVNAIAPVAATRMTEGTVPPEIVASTPPGLVSPAVILLCAQQCPVNGAIVVAGGGYFALARMVETEGIALAPADVTPEAVAQLIPRISDFTRAQGHDDALSALRVAVDAITSRE
ncbi:MAG: SDR family NAD(P)-dependent oxidoreductase [Pararhodobacter sp.]|nr:SDR family NAD(P)-dependent oxidoreductase [Pararhodobacter sp.]